MREFIRQVDENPVSYEELMTDLEERRQETLREIELESNKAKPQRS